MDMALVLVLNPSSIYVLSGSISWSGTALSLGPNRDMLPGLSPSKRHFPACLGSDLEIPHSWRLSSLWKEDQHLLTALRGWELKRTACSVWEAGQDPLGVQLEALLWDRELRSLDEASHMLNQEGSFDGWGEGDAEYIPYIPSKAN